MDPCGAAKSRREPIALEGDGHEPQQEEGAHHEVREEGWRESFDASCVEGAESERRAAPQDGLGDHVATDDEKDVDADEAAWEPAGVVGDHKGHGDGAQPVDVGSVRRRHESR